MVINSLACPSPWRAAHLASPTATTDLVIANNVFYQPTTAGVWLDTGGLTNVTVSNNLTFGGTVLVGASAATAAGNLDKTDPRFVNVGGLDFRVQSGGTAIADRLPL